MPAINPLKWLGKSLRENKTWLFGGIGVAFFGAVAAGLSSIYSSNVAPLLEVLWIHLTSQMAVPYWLLYVILLLVILEAFRLLRYMLHKYERSQVQLALKEHASQYRDQDYGTVCERTSAVKALNILKTAGNRPPVSVLVDAWEITQAVDLGNARGEGLYIAIALGIIGKRATMALPKLREELENIDPLQDKHRWQTYLWVLEKIDTPAAKKVLIEAHKREPDFLRR